MLPPYLRLRRGLRGLAGRGQRRSIRCAAVIAGAVTIGIAGLCSAGTAQAQSAKGPSARSGNDPVISNFTKQVGPAAIRNQNALSELRGWLFAKPGFARSGYVGAIDNLARKDMTVMWRGPRTPLLTALIREGARRGIGVSVQHRRYSLQQLDEATAAIWRQAAEGKWAGFKVSAIAAIPAVENGLTVEGAYTTVPAARRAPQVRSLSAVVAGVPVRIVPGHTVTSAIGTVGRAMRRPRAASPLIVNGARYSDYAPFSSGGLMGAFYAPTPPGLICSSGFSVMINGTSHAMTARHCQDGHVGALDWVDVNDIGDVSAPPTNRWYGNLVMTTADGGALVMGNTSASSMFNHGWDSTTTSTVIGYEDLAVNDYVCTEGGNSGEHCNIAIDNLSVSWNDGLGNAFSTIEGENQTPGAIAVMHGDSGGPVMSLVNTSTGQVRAAGMIQAESNDSNNCPPSYTPDPCGQTVLFSSMRTVVNNIPGGSLHTG